MYYAANNSFGSETSIGFANTWDVLAFDTKANRDDYVENGNLSTRAIKRNQVTGYIYHSPEPFTTQHYALVNHYEFCPDYMTAPKGYVGHVEISNGFMSITGDTPGYVRALRA